VNLEYSYSLLGTFLHTEKSVRKLVGGIKSPTGLPVEIGLKFYKEIMKGNQPYCTFHIYNYNSYHFLNKIDIKLKAKISNNPSVK